MKKRIYLILLSVTVIFFSCKDKKDGFTQQLFTQAEIVAALKQCLETAAFRTCEELCIVDTMNHTKGFTYCDSKSYSLDLPAAAKIVIDTLKTHSGFYNNLDSLLIADLNRAAERCNTLMRDFWTPTSKSIIFSNPNATLKGGSSAITNFVKQNYQYEFVNLLANSILKEEFNKSDLDLINRWNILQQEYNTITGTYSSIDLLAPAAQQMADGFFKKMALEEATIRKNPDLRGNPSGLFYRVFNY